MKFVSNSVVAIAILIGCLFATASGQAQEKEVQKDPRLFELRIYTTNDGKLDALNERFKNHTNALFEKHGMELIGFWTPQEDENTLIYILAYADMDARKKAWDGFLNDPEWKEVFMASRADGPLVKSVESKFMNPTDYSPLR